MIFVLYHTGLPGRPQATPAYANDHVRLPWPINPYTLTAVVDVPTIEHAFSETQGHGPQEWFFGPMILAARPERSSMIGDLFAQADGRVYLCRSTGWAELETRLWFACVPGSDERELFSYRIKLSDPSLV